MLFQEPVTRVVRHVLNIERGQTREKFGKNKKNTSKERLSFLLYFISILLIY